MLKFASVSEERGGEGKKKGAVKGIRGSEREREEKREREVRGVRKWGGKGGPQKGHRPPQKGHGSAGGANVLKLVARGPGPGPILLKFGGGPP